jgi:hypothetical protein
MVPDAQGRLEAVAVRHGASIPSFCERAYGDISHLPTRDWCADSLTASQEPGGRLFLGGPEAGLPATWTCYQGKVA